jgi:hypothetical protein
LPTLKSQYCCNIKIYGSNKNNSCTYTRVGILFYERVDILFYERVDILFYERVDILFYERVDILFTCRKHIHDRIISLTGDALAHKKEFYYSASTKSGQ